MLHIDIVCVGKLKEDYLKNAILEYAKRLSKKLLKRKVIIFFHILKKIVM